MKLLIARQVLNPNGVKVLMLKILVSLSLSLLTSQFLFSLARLSSLNSHNLRIWDNGSVKRVGERTKFPHSNTNPLQRKSTYTSAL